MIGVPKRSASTHSRAMCGPGARSTQTLAWASSRHRSIRVSTVTLPRSARPFQADATASSTTTTSASWKAALSQAAAGGGSSCVAGPVTEHEQVLGEAEAVMAVMLGQPVHRHVDARPGRRRPPGGVSATAGWVASSVGPERNRTACGSTSGEQDGDLRRQVVDDDGRVASRDPRATRSAPAVPIPSQVERTVGLASPRIPGYEDGDWSAATGRSGDRSGHEGQLTPARRASGSPPRRLPGGSRLRLP